jgi:hypothetical protein
VEPLYGASGTTGLHVGVCPLPVFEVERRLGEIVKRIFDWWWGSRFVVFFILLDFFRGLFLCFGCSGLGLSGLGVFLFFGRWHILQGFLGVLDGFEDVFQLGLVDDSLQMTDEMRELRS